MVIAISGPVSHHLGTCGLEGGVDLLHSVTEVLTIADRVAKTKDCHWLVFQVKPYNQAEVENAACSIDDNALCLRYRSGSQSGMLDNDIQVYMAAYGVQGLQPDQAMQPPVSDSAC